MRRYIGALEYRPRKSCIVTETATGPRGFTDCAGLPLLALRDIGLLARDFDPNFPGSSNREREILRVLRRLGKRVGHGKSCPYEKGDVLVTGTPRMFHVMTVSDALRDSLRIIEAPRAHGWVCERALDAHEIPEIRSAFRLFNG